MSQFIFLIILAIVSFWGYKGFRNIYQNILLGKNEVINGDTSIRWRNVIFIAFGQKKMFKNFIPALFHLFIYAAFLLTQIELLELMVDGLFGTHRFFSFLGGFYDFIINFIEILSLLAFIATMVFLSRRNLLKVPRLVKSELNGWPKIDANLILVGEILLIVGIFSMNGAESVLQNRLPDSYHTHQFYLSSMVSHLFTGFSNENLISIVKMGWWLHTLVVFAFIVYLPYSKHLHIFLSFPNVYFSKLSPRGAMDNMPEIMNEVKSMLGLGPETPSSDDIPKFGASDVMDLSWKNLLDAYSCTECGRCTAQCPANITGKKLSPRKIMMDVRDRTTEVGDRLRSKNKEFFTENSDLIITNFNDNKSLFNYISKEEINACTTCNACVEACPVLINPLDIILQLRRYQMLTESSAPEEWTPMFTSLENQGAVWQVPDSRAAWTQH